MSNMNFERKKRESNRKDQRRNRRKLQSWRHNPQSREVMKVQAWRREQWPKSGWEAPWSQVLCFKHLNVSYVATRNVALKGYSLLKLWHGRRAQKWMSDSVLEKRFYWLLNPSCWTLSISAKFLLQNSSLRSISKLSVENFLLIPQNKIWLRLHWIHSYFQKYW